MIKVNKNHKLKTVPVRIIKKIVELVLSSEKPSEYKQMRIDVNFIDDELMTELNETYKKRSGTTDILSFNFNEQEEKYYFLGELYLSVPVLEKQAKQMGHSIEKELAILLIHGTLHLLGYEHHNGKAKRLRMEKAEQKYFKVVEEEIFRGEFN